MADDNLTSKAIPQRAHSNIWDPLPSAFSTRVLRLLPGGSDDRIECVLETISLEDSHCRYQALSYIWGSKENMIDITCNARAHAITRNLHSAMRRLRETDSAVTLWIDALSIDQSDTPTARQEREAQVQLMWKIFSSAGKVVANLGDAVDDQKGLEQLLQVFRDLPAHLQENSDMEELEAGCHTLPDLSHACWPTLTYVLSLDYWKRVWIIQECVLATRLEFLLGHVRYGSDFLAVMLQARLYGQFLVSRHVPSGLFTAAGEGDTYFRTKNSNVASLLSVPPSECRYASVIDTLRSIWWQNSAPEHEPYRRSIFYGHMLASATHKATDIRDRVYSLLDPLRQDGQCALEVSYSKSEKAEHTALRATRYLIDAKIGPRILYKGVYCQGRLPSWMINIWQSTTDWLSDLCILDQGCMHFNACGSTSLSLRLDPNPDSWRLFTDAVVLDEVVNMSSRNACLPPETWGTGKVVDSIPWISDMISWIESVTSQGSGSNIFEAQDLWRTATADMYTDSQRSDPDADLSARIEVIKYMAKARAALAAMPNSVYRLAQPSSMAQMMEKLGSYDNVEELMGEIESVMSLLDQSGLEPENFTDEEKALREPYQGLLQYIPADRRLGTTQNGMMALIPDDTQLGDVLAIILGAPIPFVLRKTGNGFRIVGSCYTHYMMDGQALESHL